MCSILVRGGVGYGGGSEKWFDFGSSLKVELGFFNRIDVECKREVKDDFISLLSIYKDGVVIR